MSRDIVERVEEKMTLSAAQEALLFVLRQPDGSGLEELMIELPALLKTLKNDNQACTIGLLTKIMHECSFLPTIEPGSLMKDLFFTQDALEKLKSKESAIHLVEILQQDSRRPKKRGLHTSRPWTVRLVGLLARMACVVRPEEDSVEWNSVKATVQRWVRGSFSHLLPHEVTAGLALFCLDALDSATALEPTVGGIAVTGLTPRLVGDMLKSS